MLYITTRNHKDAFTAHHALTEKCAADGGGYIPFKMPLISSDELRELTDKPLDQIVADILNLFFPNRLTGWDVDCCIGRAAFHFNVIHHRICVTEFWHNPQGDFDFIVNSLYEKYATNDASCTSEWFIIAVRIAMLFAVYSELLKQEHCSESEMFDICLPVDDFSSIMAAYYARIMGLPIQEIICTELENSCFWDLIQRGTLNTWLCNDAMHSGIERLIQTTIGFEAVNMYREKRDNKQIFFLNDEQHNFLREGLFCSVVGNSRIDNIISSVYRSCDYIIDPQTALCHGGLQDFRAKTGNSRVTLLLADKTPMNARKAIADATGLDGETLLDHIHKL